MAQLTPLSAFPAVAPDDPTLDGKVFRADSGNALEISGKCLANSGRLYLLRHVSGTDWQSVDVDAQDLKSLPVDATKPTGTEIQGQFSGSWLIGDSTVAYYAVLLVGTATFTGGKVKVTTQRL